MSDELDQLLYKSAAEIARLRNKLQAAGAPSQTPVAIIGLACRAPGNADTPEELWEIFAEGRDALAPFPDRWSPLNLPVTRGGFLSCTELFDPSFFAISPREARAMDPQQRLVLEVAWEAIERARLDPLSLRGSNTGTFLGAQTSDYSLLATSEELAGTMGSLLSFVAGRLSYSLDLRGPSLVTDTACSSSLVATHLACAALRAGECDLALAGGVQTMSTPAGFLESLRQGQLAPDGRCKSFSASADGAGWSEGVALLVLKRLPEAQRDGDSILAVIKSSAVNQDGRSHGLTAPNRPSQVRVLRSALSLADLQPEDIDAVEAHGTGTRLGDPIEAGALSDVFGGRTRAAPLWLGSSKSNIGHAQAAAGVLGVIKMVLALQHELLPRTLHCEKPSEHIDWDQSGLALLQEARPWPRREGHLRRAGVSSFGISGTNAHLVLQEAPFSLAGPREEPPVPTVLPLVISAKSPRALIRNARQLARHLQLHPTISHLDLCYSLATTRTAFPFRCSLTVGNDDQAGGYPALREALLALSPPVHEPTPGRLAVLFSGQGSQRQSMGLSLLDQPGFETFGHVYQELLTQCDQHLPRPLKEVIAQDDALEQTLYAQPALFCLEAALFRQWQAWGVHADVLLGHSLGELVAAYVAEVLPTQDAVRLVCARARLMQELATPNGGMLSVTADREQVLAALGKLPSDLQDQLTIAALNSAAQTVVSGDAEAVDKLEAILDKHIPRRRLRVSHAFHSHHMEPLLEAFHEVASGLVYQRPTIPVVGNLSGEVVERFDASYWVEQSRQTVLFARGLETARGMGVTTFLECGPGAGLSLLAEGIPSLHSQQAEPSAMMSALGQLHERHHTVDWQAFYRRFAAARVSLPTYSFERERYWPAERHQPTAPAQGASEGDEGLPLLPEPKRLPWLLSEIRAEIARVLGMPGPDSIPATRPLHEMGLDSVKAVELRNNLMRKLRIQLPATFAFEQPHAQSMALHLLGSMTRMPANSPPPRPEALVTLKQGRRKPLFLFPGVWGGVLGFRDFARSLPEEYTVIALDLEATTPAARYTLETAVEFFLQEIRKKYPRGPYDLLGFSTGGLFAFEMALRLKEETGALILLDTMSPTLRPSAGRSRFQERASKLWTYARILREASAREGWRLIRKRLKEIFSGSSSRQGPPITLGLWLASQYHHNPAAPPVYQGTMHVLRYSFQPRSITDKSLGWASLATRLQVHETPGVHSATALQPPVIRSTARLVAKILEDA